MSFAIATFALLAMALSAPRSRRKYWLTLAVVVMAIDAISATNATTTTEPWVPLVGVTFGSIAYVASVSAVLSVWERNKRVQAYARRQSAITKEVN